jgi:4a-hydroxytetrahydrobiopterin dehydratase
LWQVIDDYQLLREFRFENFKQALDFVNKVGKTAEKEGHHPDIYIYDWKKVRLTLTTHAIGGLSINDFVLASKIDLIF